MLPCIFYATFDHVTMIALLLGNIILLRAKVNQINKFENI